MTKNSCQDFPGGTVDTNLPVNTWDTVQSLVWEDSTCLRATKHMHPLLNPPAEATGSCGLGACALHQEKPPHNERPVPHNEG